MPNKKHHYGGTKRVAGDGSAVPIAKKENDASDQEHKLNDSRFWLVRKWCSLETFDQIMAVLTLAGVLIAFFTGLIFVEQLKEMRTDQRAWIAVTSGMQLQGPKDEDSIANAPLTATVTLGNTGKTAARNVIAAFVLEYVVQGDSPSFGYNGAVTLETGGIMFPNAPMTVNVTFSKPKPNAPGETEPRFLTKSEFADLGNENAYMALYGQITYTDIFGVDHWMHYCNWSGRPGTFRATAKKCSDYNDTDRNEYLLPSIHF